MPIIVIIMEHRRFPVSLPVGKALLALGADMRDARLRRRIPAAVLAARARIARQTLHKIERGDPTVSMGAYASVLFALGMHDRIATLASAREDTVGLALDEERLPERVYLPGTRRRARKTLTSDEP